jgi:YhcN/YlaJ family sporulation lipoprotein
MKKRHYLLSVLAIVLALMLVVSCAPARRPGDNVPQLTPGTRQTRFVPRNAPNQPPMTSPGPMNQDRRNIGDTDNLNRDRTRDNRTIGTTDTNMQDRAEEIANAAAKQKEVESAACVITGNTAMVGLQFDDQYKGDLTDAIKKQVEKRVKNADKRITRVVVTADPDMVSRLEEIFEDIGKGRPISGFTEELNEMINRINPR